MGPLQSGTYTVEIDVRRKARTANSSAQLDRQITILAQHFWVVGAETTGPPLEVVLEKRESPVSWPVPQHRQQ